MNLGNLDLKKSAATLSIGGVVTAGALFGVLDNRYASASDVDVLVQAIQEDRVERLEVQIADAERRIKRIMVKPVEQRNEYEVQDLLDLEATRERLLRKLERLNGRY